LIYDTRRNATDSEGYTPLHAGSARGYVDTGTYEKTLSGTGNLPNTSTCYVYSETFKLLPRSLGRILAEISKAHIILPHIQEILRSDEKDLLQKPSHLPTTLHPLTPLYTERPG
jgi:hypothetical protein